MRNVALGLFSVFCLGFCALGLYSAGATAEAGPTDGYGISIAAERR